MNFKISLLLIWLAAIAIVVLFIYLRPFNEIILLALIVTLGLLGIMLYTRKHEDSGVTDSDVSQ